LNRQKATTVAIRNNHSIAHPPPGVPAERLEGKWSFSLETELEMADDLINDFMIFYKSNDFHLCTAFGPEKRV